jgi:hypothetical protein
MRFTAQTVNFSPLSAESRVQSQVFQRGLSGGQSGKMAVTSPRTSVFNCQFHSTNAQYPFIRHCHHVVLVKGAVFTEHTVQCTGCSHNRHQKGKIFISELVRYSDVRFATFQTNNLEVFYCLVHFSVGTIGGTNNSLEIFCVFPRAFGACCGHPIYSIPYAGFRLPTIVIFVLYVIP